ncbi:4'-phosphopantetheinyl transferase family protein [Streptomyces sp. NPDC018000]|uniref:4'-phosphopantetheinyl transferase family protein n=1 Tax=Streptomyces sp. NPDC018000 TaxID=3365028 RepID=UPI0037BD79E9
MVRFYGPRSGDHDGGYDVLVACAPFAAASRRELLSGKEAVRAASFPPVRAREFAAGRALLRWALGYLFGSGARACRIGVTGKGRPMVEDLPSTGVSISHSGGMVAVAVSTDRAVGVDIQAPVPPTPGLLRRCCSPEQQRELFALPAAQQASALARRWTIHEACVKATGEGLSRRGEICPGPLFASVGRCRAFGWRVLPSYGVCAVAVAFSGPAEGAVVRRLLVNDLDHEP